MKSSNKKYDNQYIIEHSLGSPYSLKQIQNRLLNMMVQFDCFCKKHNITYFLAGGTLLGAVRHKGFIPWDDDVDILVPRKDYEKLLSFGSISDELDIVSYKNDCGYYHPYPYCNIVDKKTIMLEHNSKEATGKGLFLDIFPLDIVPDNSHERNRFYKKLKIYKYLKGLPSFPYKKIKTFKDLIFNICSFSSGIFDEMIITKKIDKLASTYQNESSNFCAELLVGPTERLTWPSICFSRVLRVEFEGKEFNIPADYDELLTIQYGDYMTPPPVEEQKGHHEVEVFERANC